MSKASRVGRGASRVRRARSKNTSLPRMQHQRRRRKKNPGKRGCVKIAPLRIGHHVSNARSAPEKDIQNKTKKKKTKNGLIQPWPVLGRHPLRQKRSKRTLLYVRLTNDARKQWTKRTEKEESCCTKERYGKGKKNLHAGKFTPIDCLANCPRERLLANQNGSKQGKVPGSGYWCGACFLG